MQKTFLNTEPGERLTWQDFQRVSKTSLIEALSQLGQDLFLGTDVADEDQAAETGRVLWGFTPSSSGTTVSVSRGAALVGTRIDGELRFGILLAGGEAQRSLNTGSFFVTDDYGVWVRFVLQEEQLQNRLKWDPEASPAGEVVHALPVVLAENWELAIEINRPGPEWIRVGDWDLNLQTLTPARTFAFEGREANSFLLDDTDWGDADDRSDDRATFGIKSIFMLLMAILRQIQDIIDFNWPTPNAARWYKDPNSGTTTGVGPRSLTRLNAEKLPIAGASVGMRMTGNLEAESDSINLGSTSKPWGAIYATSGDGFKFDAAQTFKRTLHGVAINTAINSGSPAFARNLEYFRKSGTGGWSGLVSLDELPNGAILTLVEIFCNVDLNAADSVLLAIGRCPKTASPTAEDLLAAGSVSLNTSAADQVVTYTPDQNNTIDHNAYAYALSIVNSGITLDDTTTIYSIELTYTLTEVEL